jgi:glycosyltransferase involved in cell wall biosynthesis
MECRAAVAPTSRLLEADHDVVIFNNPPDYRLARRARARLKVFYVLALYDRDRLKRFDPRIVWPKRGRMLSLKRCLQLPFLHVANATWMQRWLRENLGLEVELQLGGINRELFRPVAADRDPAVLRILCSGDPREHKGAATVLEAVDRVREHVPNVTVDTYYGRGIPQSQMAQTYCAADLFVDAQWYAGWNNPVAEAMACGVPVVCSDIGGVEDFAFHERTALLAPARDVDAFARAIERMARSPKLRRSLAHNALEEVSRFDWDASTESFLDLLHHHAGLERHTSASTASPRTP